MVKYGRGLGSAAAQQQGETAAHSKGRWRRIASSIAGEAASAARPRLTLAPLLRLRMAATCPKMERGGGGGGGREVQREERHGRAPDGRARRLRMGERRPG
ncbi:hypothetical protein PVAP13_8NG224601 [Panicum virgatum]|uniref:Uncharacterized protein n=1 Tax=Panicum virgatum TaxID=38727 RepID=A0A8T0P6R9_PANVG|nr:hypothetical protein PVAP13_8NG224601 [Panicum virgatum]